MTQIPDDEAIQAGHEVRGVRMRPLLLSVAALALLALFAFAAMWGLTRLLESSRQPAAPTIPAVAPTSTAQTVLEPDQQTQRLRYERRQQELLGRYEWTDKRQTSARIPIERAMTLIEQRYQSDEGQPE